MWDYKKDLNAWINKEPTKDTKLRERNLKWHWDRPKSNVNRKQNQQQAGRKAVSCHFDCPLDTKLDKFDKPAFAKQYCGQRFEQGSNQRFGEDN